MSFIIQYRDEKDEAITLKGEYAKKEDAINACIFLKYESKINYYVVNKDQIPKFTKKTNVND